MTLRSRPVRRPTVLRLMAPNRRASAATGPIGHRVRRHKRRWVNQAKPGSTSAEAPQQQRDDPWQHRRIALHDRAQVRRHAVFVECGRCYMRLELSQRGLRGKVMRRACERT